MLNRMIPSREKDNTTRGVEKITPKGKVEGEQKPSETGEHMTIHAHGDGTYHSEHSDGTREEHEDGMHALAHAAHKFEPNGKHHIAHHDGFETKSHGIHETGEHEGTRDHENVEDLKDSMGKFMDEEEGDKPASAGDAWSEPDMSGLG